MSRRIKVGFGLGSGVLAILVVGCAPGAATNHGAPLVEASQLREVMDVLDAFMDGLNALDFEAHVATYHFPHYRHASGRIEVWSTPDEAMPILQLPAEDRLEAARAALEPDWVRSEWLRRDIVQASATKVHVATRFARLRADGSVIKTFDSLYVLTLEPDRSGHERWGIRGRSSFAP